MEHPISGRLSWDTTHAATPGWLLFLDGRPGDTPTMLPGFETCLPRDCQPCRGGASHWGDAPAGNGAPAVAGAVHPDQGRPCVLFCRDL